MDALLFRVIRRARLPKEARKGLLNFGTKDDPEFVKNKSRGEEDVASNFVELFLKIFDCDNVQLPGPNFPWECLEKNSC